MARTGPTDIVSWIGGLDLAGPGSLMEANDVLTAPNVDTTGLGDGVRTQGALGTVEYMITENGWLDTHQSSLRDLLKSGAPDTPWPSIFGYGGGDIGSDVTIATDMRLTRHDVLASLDDLTKISTEFYLQTGADVYENATLIAHGLVTGVVDNGLNPAAAYRHDNGASSNTGATVCLMVDVEGSRFRGYPSLDIDLRHSSTAGSGYADIGTALNVDRDDKGAIVFEIASGTTINRYLAVRFRFHGTRGRYQTTTSYSTGDRTIVVDGASGLERIQAGDMMDVAGFETLEVESATDQGSGSWEITFTTGLGQNVADNEDVEHDGSNVELRYAAAIIRH